MDPPSETELLHRLFAALIELVGERKMRHWVDRMFADPPAPGNGGLTAEEVDAIQREYRRAERVCRAQLAEQYGCSPDKIAAICVGLWFEMPD